MSITSIYIFTIYARVRPHIHIFLHSTYLFYFLCAILPFILYSSPCASLCVVLLLTYGSCGRGLPFCVEREAESEAKLKTQQSAIHVQLTLYKSFYYVTIASSSSTILCSFIHTGRYLTYMHILYTTCIYETSVSREYIHLAVFRV